MKVRLHREKVPYYKTLNWWRERTDMGSFPITSSPPFYVGATGARAHRVRSGLIHWNDKRGVTHWSLRLWCGTGGSISAQHKGRLIEEPPRGTPVCATCEGRAIGAGQLGSHKIAGRMVIFSPQ